MSTLKILRGRMALPRETELPVLVPLTCESEGSGTGLVTRDLTEAVDHVRRESIPGSALLVTRGNTVQIRVSEGNN